MKPSDIAYIHVSIWSATACIFNNTGWLMLIMLGLSLTIGIIYLILENTRG